MSQAEDLIFPLFLGEGSAEGELTADEAKRAKATGTMDLLNIFAVQSEDAM